jgi:glucose/arabinose dehydrogenase
MSNGLPAATLMLLTVQLAFSQASNIPHDLKYRPKDQYFEALPPAEAIKTIEVPAGYHLECVASEPMVQEPASFAFDEDGAIYVCEWLTYMQDEYGTGQLDETCRVVKLVDSDGDGKMDLRTVFIDKIRLPRTVLPLKDRVLVNITQESTVWAYFDKDGDGVADSREPAFPGGPQGGNIEHQASGLIWNLDNYIYSNDHPEIREVFEGDCRVIYEIVSEFEVVVLTVIHMARLYAPTS